MKQRVDNIFENSMVTSLPSNRFDMRHSHRTTFSMGELIPIASQECMPGDVWKISNVNFLRFMPLLAPIMHQVRVMTRFYFVPERILWSGFEDWFTGVSTEEMPYVRLDYDVNVGSLAHYLGVPAGNYEEKPINIKVFKFAAYLKIYDEWFRPQQFMLEQFKTLVPGNNSATYDSIVTGPPLMRAWEHDYLTSALPEPQQGTAVELPLTFEEDIPVELSATNFNNQIIKTAAAHGNAGGFTLRSENATPSVLEGQDGTNLVLDPNGTLVVDVQSDAATIDALRQAWILQGFLERVQRGGIRYFEQLISVYGTHSPDARLQRPEYIGGSFQTMAVSEVLATAQSNNDGSTAQVGVGTMAGHGVSAGSTDSLTYVCQEHGWLFAIINVQPVTGYVDGLHRSWFRFDRLDYPIPAFAHLGEQGIFEKEVKAHDLSVGTTPDAIWGYIPRYEEMRFAQNWSSGEFVDSLSYWTLDRIFGEPFVEAPIPGLNEAFINANPSARIFGVTDADEDHILAQVFMNWSVRRRLPRYAIPAVVG